MDKGQDCKEDLRYIGEGFEDKIEELLQQLKNQIVKFITGYDFHINTYYDVFKV